MNMRQCRDVPERLLTVASIAAFLFASFLRLRLGLGRFFDADEFAYLHWAHNIYAGSVPLRDFFLYIPPGFPYILAPVYAFVSGTDILTVSRIGAWIVWVATAVLLGRVFPYVTGQTHAGMTWRSVLPGLIFLSLPMPADKLLEVRPDTLSLCVAVAAMFYQARVFAGGSVGHARISGFLYAVSVMILPKTAIQAVFAAVVFAVWSVYGSNVRAFRIASIRGFFAGAAIPACAAAAWMVIAAGGPDTFEHFIYQLTVLPFEVNRIAAQFGMQPDLFFYPNSVYYGTDGWNTALIINHAVWLIGLGAGLVRLFTPYLAGGTGGSWIRVLTAGSFFAYVTAFMYLFPLRHAQYLIAPAAFVSLFAADAVGSLVHEAGNRFRPGIQAGLLAGMSVLVVSVAVPFGPKLRMSNAADYTFLSAVLTRIPRGSYVFDLVGSTIYYTDPYPWSGVPFGQWAPYLSRSLPSVSRELEDTGTRYVYSGLLNRVNDLPVADRSFIISRFAAVPGLPGLLEKVGEKSYHTR